MNLKPKLKEFGVNMFAEIVVGVVRGFLNEAIKDVKPADLYNSIKNNLDLWSVTPNDIKSVGRGLKLRFRPFLEKYQDMINVDLILEWLKRDKPELYSVIINTDGGVEWLERQINTIKSKIMEEL